MIIFEIENRKEDYALCFAIINMLKENDMSNEKIVFENNDSIIVRIMNNENFFQNNQYSDSFVDSNHLDYIYNNKNKFPSITNFKKLELMDFIDRNLREKKYFPYIFFVNDSGQDDSDVINYHYFELIRKFETEIFLVVIPNSKATKSQDSELYFSLSAFFHIESNVDTTGYNHRWFYDAKNANVNGQSKNFKRLAKINKASRRIFPLFKTDQLSYRLFAQGSKEFFGKDFEKEGLFSNKYFSEILRNEYVRNDSDEIRKQNDYEIYCESTKLFIAKLYDDLTIKLYDKSQKEKLSINFPIMKMYDLSVLALLYFLTFIHAIVYTKDAKIKDIKNNIEKLNDDQIDELLFDAEDYAEGTLQLIENVIKHANKNGFFCYRLLSNHRAKALYKNVDECIFEEFLNVLISDFNILNDIPTKFNDNLMLRLRNKNDKDIAIYQSIYETFQDIKLSDFFTPKQQYLKAWEKYLSIPENIAFHYGLSVFEKVVSAADGYFAVISTNKMHFNEHTYYQNIAFLKNKSNQHIPGTQYIILLPLKKVDNTIKSGDTGLNKNIDYSSLNPNKWNFIQITNNELSEVFKENILSMIGKYSIELNTFELVKYNPAFKNDQIDLLKNFLCTKMEKCQENDFLLIDASNIKDLLECEILAKAIICYIGNINKLNKIAIINCNGLLRSVLIRIIGTLYYKITNSTIIKNAQIYFCDDCGKHEVEFFKNNLPLSIRITKEMGIFKGDLKQNYREVALLEKINDKSDKETIELVEDAVFPLNIVTFLQSTRNDLMRDIQKLSFGCKLNNIHMRVGSKVHISESFYEATLLFGISNYVSRFAYLLAENIAKKIKLTDSNRLVLVGYETYSELLMVELQNALKICFSIDSSYIIYHNDRVPTYFSRVETIEDGNRNLKEENINFAIIVPIGSTLTTHDKIVAFLKRQYPKIQYENIISNQCVILIRDEFRNGNEQLSTQESKFWSHFDEENLCVSLNEDYKIGKDNLIQYLICIKNKWHSRNDCPLCYPSILTDEKPILKVNKASVVPMTLYGLIEKPSKDVKPKFNYGLDYSNLKKEIAEKIVKYGHRKRNDNHFEYYFDTEIMMNEIKNKDNIELNDSFTQWLYSIKTNIETTLNKTIHQYHFIVAPLHSTNAQFIQIINQEVFDSVSEIIWLDAKREYREVIEAKFSNLTQLYYNLTKSNTPSQINIHYVDDTIITGDHFRRCKNLMQSLFYDINNNSLVKVNIFESIILLLSRCSENTKYQYIDDINKYYYFLNLKISSMRNHKDACSLCQQKNNFKSIRRLSATNPLYNNFNDEYKKNDIWDIFSKSYENSLSHEEPKDELGYYKGLYTHIINSKLSLYQENSNYPQYILNILINQLYDILKNYDINLKDTTDRLCAFLRVISTPFLLFRKDVHEASFQLILHIANYIIFKNDELIKIFLYNELNKNDIMFFLKKYIDKLEKTNENKNLLMKLLVNIFNQISILGANYVFRAKIINGFFRYINSNSLNQDKNWIEFYSFIVKQALCFNRQDSRSLWLENLIMSGDENRENIESLDKDNHLDENDDIKNLRNIILLENNIIVFDVLDEITKLLNIKNGERDSVYINNNSTTDDAIKFINIKNDNSKKIIIAEALNQYFCEDYRSLNEINGKISENSEFVNDMLNMAKLKFLLMPSGNISEENDNQDTFYNNLLNYIAKIVRANNSVQLFVEINKGQVYRFIDSSNPSEYEGNSDFIDALKNKDNGIFVIANTLYYDNINVIIQIDNNTGNDKSSWYLCYQKDKQQDTIDDIIKTVRNLLVMREDLMLRFQKDFDNNLFQEFDDMKNKISKFTDKSAKSASHTPFEDIKELFEEIYNATKDNNIKCDFKKIYSKEIMLLTDSLISKWYLFSVTKGLPQINLSGQYSTREISFFQNLIKLADYFVGAFDGGMSKVDIDWGIFWDNADNILIDYPQGLSCLWLFTFFAAIMNAIRHGKHVTCSGEVKYKVKVIVRFDNDYIIIQNDKLEDEENRDSNGITLIALEYFFQKYYDNEFYYEKNSNNFIVYLPIKSKKNSKENNND